MQPGADRDSAARGDGPVRFLRDTGPVACAASAHLRQVRKSGACRPHRGLRLVLVGTFLMLFRAYASLDLSTLPCVFGQEAPVKASASIHVSFVCAWGDEGVVGRAFLGSCHDLKLHIAACMERLLEDLEYYAFTTCSSSLPPNYALGRGRHNIVSLLRIFSSGTLTIGQGWGQASKATSGEGAHALEACCELAATLIRASARAQWLYHVLSQDFSRGSDFILEGSPSFCVTTLAFLSHAICRARWILGERVVVLTRGCLPPGVVTS